MGRVGNNLADGGIHHRELPSLPFGHRMQGSCVAEYMTSNRLS